MNRGEDRGNLKAFRSIVRRMTHNLHLGRGVYRSPAADLLLSDKNLLSEMIGNVPGMAFD